MLVASATAEPSLPAFDLQRLAFSARILRDGTAERLSLSDGFHHLRVDVVEGTLLDGPVRLRFVIADDDRASAQILALQRFRAFCRGGVFGRTLNPPERHGTQWVRQLRAYDAVEPGASERTIAMELFARRFSDYDWRTSDALRSAVRRLIGGARRMVGGSYLTLLS